MSIGMFTVGATLFAVYIFFTVWNIVYNNARQVEERKTYKDNSPVDELDSDGMGDFTRFPKK